MVLMGRMRTMFRMFQASTPVESFCDVVRMVGMVFLLSWKSRRCCSPRAPSSAVSLEQLDQQIERRRT